MFQSWILFNINFLFIRKQSLLPIQLSLFSIDNLFLKVHLLESFIIFNIIIIKILTSIKFSFFTILFFVFFIVILFIRSSFFLRRTFLFVSITWIIRSTFKCYSSSIFFLLSFSTFTIRVIRFWNQLKTQTFIYFFQGR